MSIITTTVTATGVTPLGTPTGAGITTGNVPTGSGVTEAGTPTARLDPTDYNVVIILIDDAGPDQFEWYGRGADYAYTPTLSGMVDTGVTFTRAYANPICGPTRLGVQTGYYAKTNGLAANLVDPDDNNFRANDDLTYLPEMFDDGRPTSRYATGAFGKWHMSGPAQQSHPFTNGWNRYFGHTPNAAWTGYSLGHFRWKKVTATTGYTAVPATWTPTDVYSYPDGLVYDSTCYDACVNARDALQWMNSRTKPFVCYLAMNPPHSPYERPPNTMPDDIGVGATMGTIQLVPTSRQTELDGLGVTGVGQKGISTAQARSVFRAATECVDTLIGWVRSRMDPEVLAKTVFIIWSDNGTVANIIDSPYEGGHAKRTLYEQGIWAAAVVHGPPTIVAQPGREITALTHVVDITRTVCDICNVDLSLSPGAAGDSISFLPLLKDPDATPPRDYIYSELFTPLGGPPRKSTWSRALTRDYDGVPYKLIRDQNGTEQMFRVDDAAGWNTGSTCWLEKESGGTGNIGDNYIPVITTTAPDAVKAIYADLSARLTGLENTVTWTP